MGAAYSHAPSVNDFEQGSTGKQSSASSSISLRVREWPAISSLCWHLLAFRRDVHLSSSLINNNSVCGPQDSPCILMTAVVGAKRTEKRGRKGMEWSGRRWSRVEWSGVRGECKMGSVSCILWLRAQDAPSNQQRPLSWPQQISTVDG